MGRSPNIRSQEPVKERAGLGKEETDSHFSPPRKERIPGLQGWAPRRKKTSKSRRRSLKTFMRHWVGRKEGRNILSSTVPLQDFHAMGAKGTKVATSFGKKAKTGKSAGGGEEKPLRGAVTPSRKPSCRVGTEKKKKKRRKVLPEKWGQKGKKSGGYFEPKSPFKREKRSLHTGSDIPKIRHCHQVVETQKKRGGPRRGGDGKRTSRQNRVISSFNTRVVCCPRTTEGDTQKGLRTKRRQLNARYTNES